MHYVLLANAEPDAAAAIKLPRKAVELADQLMAAKRLSQRKGEFWVNPETRPYMRARLALARMLWQNGQHAEAIEHLRELLELNPADHQGVRYILAECLIEAGRDTSSRS